MKIATYCLIVDILPRGDGFKCNVTLLLRFFLLLSSTFFFRSLRSKWQVFFVCLALLWFLRLLRCSSLFPGRRRRRSFRRPMRREHVAASLFPFLFFFVGWFAFWLELGYFLFLIPLSYIQCYTHTGLHETHALFNCTITLPVHTYHTVPFLFALIAFLFCTLFSCPFVLFFLLFV